MDTKTPSVREAAREAALGLIAAHSELWDLEPWTSTRLPAEPKRTLNAVIADWVARNEPPLTVHEFLAPLIRDEHPLVGENRYQVRLAMAHHLRDGWAGKGRVVAVPQVAPPRAPAPVTPVAKGIDVETLVRQALAETEPEPGDGLGDDPLPEPEAAPEPVSTDWECGLCGLQASDQDTLVAHVGTCGLEPEAPEAAPEEPLVEPEEPGAAPDGEDPLTPQSPNGEDGERFQCAQCGMVTEGAEVLADHLTRCQGAERTPRTPRRLTAVPKPAGRKAAKAKGRK